MVCIRSVSRREFPSDGDVDRFLTGLGIAKGKCDSPIVDGRSARQFARQNNGDVTPCDFHLLLVRYACLPFSLLCWLAWFESVINSFSTTNLRVRSRVVWPRYTEPLRPRLRALVSQTHCCNSNIDYNSSMTGLAEKSETWASHRAAHDLPYKRLALEAARRQLGVCRVFNFDRARCGEHELHSHECKLLNHRAHQIFVQFENANPVYLNFTRKWEQYEAKTNTRILIC
eukprot:1363403-Pleurochrysis_carterae.AAC.1